ncbi:MAG: hypothetical protein R3C05_24005 [Pirellulaceae bacterium]
MKTFKQTTIRLIWFCVLQVGLSCVMPTEGRAEQPLAQFPVQGAKHRGFTVQATAGDASTIGQCLVRFQFRAVGPRFAADRQLTIELRPRGSSISQNTFDFQQQVTLPQGSTAEDIVLQVPVYYPWQHCRIRLLEDDRPLPGYDTQQVVPVLASKQNVTEFSIAVIEARTVDSDPPDWRRFPDCRTLRVLYAGEEANQLVNWSKELSHAEAIGTAEGVPAGPFELKRYHEDRLPTMWTHYASFDVLLVSAKVLRRIADENPLGFQAIREWLGCGGVMWCYGGEHPDSIDDVLKIDEAWQSVSPTMIANAKNLFFEQRSSIGQARQHLFNQTVDRIKETTPMNHPLLDDESSASLLTRLRTNKFLAGTIVYLHDPYPFPGSFQQWMITSVASADRIGTQNRLGIDIENGDNAFWNWLIAEVGQPPVYTFLGMISLFVLLVGPASYYFFMYIKRLYLFFIFAPVVALVCTTCIFLYALIADGFGSRVRVRHLTLLDTEGHAASWSRQTYFSGLRPRDGVAWSRQCLVYPITEKQTQSEASGPSDVDENAANRITVDEESTRFEGRFMPSRAQVQFMAIEPALNAGALVASRQQGRVNIKNLTPWPIQQVLLTDPSGTHWMAETIPARGQSEAVLMEPIAVSRWMTEVYLNNAPEPPLVTRMRRKANCCDWEINA